MIRAAHSRWGVFRTRLLYRFLFRLFFRKVRIVDAPAPEERPILMTGNHFSWWDGFIAEYINLRCFGKRMFIMMLEEQLNKRKFLRKAGAYSISPGRKDILESLRYTVEKLKSPGHLVVMYPQGKIQSMHEYDLSPEKGISLIYNKLTNGISSGSEAAPLPSLVIYCALTDYFSYPRPSLWIYMKELPFSTLSSLESLSSAYGEFYRDCIRRQKMLAD